MKSVTYVLVRAFSLFTIYFVYNAPAHHSLFWNCNSKTGILAFVPLSNGLIWLRFTGALVEEVSGLCSICIQHHFSFLTKSPPQKCRRAATPGPPPPGSLPPPPLSITNMPSSPTAQRKAHNILTWASHAYFLLRAQFGVGFMLDLVYCAC